MTDRCKSCEESDDCDDCDGGLFCACPCHEDLANGPLDEEDDGEVNDEAAK